MQQPYKYKPSWIKISLLALAVITLGAGGFFLLKKLRKPPATAQTYEALVAVTDQKSSDPVEDARSSLKTGDVITILPEGHNWSETEKISYLILKMKLTEDEAKKLTQAETREVKGEEREEREEKDEKGERGPQMETIRARQYRLKIETLGFDRQKFWENNQQPFQDKVFDWKLAEKKK